MTEKLTRNVYLEGILELGRNWALGVAITSAGIAALFTESVDGPKDWEQYFAAICVLFSIAWLFLAGLRFWEVVKAWMNGRPGKSGKVVGILVYAVLVLTATSILVSVKQFATNAQIIKICESGHSVSGSKIPEYNECKRLAAKRKDLSDRLEDRGPYAGRAQ